MVFSFSQARAVARSCVRASSKVLRAVAMTVTRVSCSVHDSGGGLSHGCGIILLLLGGSGSLLPIDGGEVGVAARHSQQDGGG
jgi:hypothetical protein